MQIRLSVTSVRDPSRSAPGQRVVERHGAGRAATDPLCVDVTITAAAGTAFSAAAGALRTLAGIPGGLFHCGSAPVPDDAPLGLPPLLDGAALTVGGPGSPTALPGGPELHVVGGPDAGGVFLLSPPPAGAPAATIAIGRGADADIRIEDPDLSRLHAELLVSADWVRLRDAGSTNGTTLDATAVGPEPVLMPPEALVRLGESTVVLRMSRACLEVEPDRLGRLRVRTVRRPPTVLPAPRIELPPPPANRGLPTTRRRAGAAFELAKAAAQARIAQALAEEAALRRERHPDLAALLTTAVRPEPGLWARDPRAGGFLELRLGTARITSRITVDSGQKTFRPRLAAAPVTVDLEEAGVLGLVGPRPHLDALARSLLAQLAGVCSPGELEIVVLCGGRPDTWQWTRWLPHLIPRDGQDCRALVGLDPEQVSTRVAELTGRLAARRAQARATGRRWEGRRTVLVLDPVAALSGERGVQRLLAEGPALGLFPIVLAARPAELPDATGAMVVVGGDVHTRLRLERPDSPSLDGIVADLVSAEWAERFARAIAPLRESDGFSAPQLPEEARLLALLDLDLLTPAKLAARWTATEPRTELVVGTDDHGPVRTDLAGHHVLVGGASGAGVSETLRSIVCALTAVNRPSHLRVTLVSGGRGPSLEQCAALAHVDRHLPAGASGEALRGLLDQVEAQVERRAAASGDGPRRDPPDSRLLLVLDGLDELADGHPWFVKGLGALARDGRAHGLHVAVGVTLEDQAAIRLLDTELCDEAQIRFALRTHGPQESRKIASLPSAASLRDDTPGRAHLALPDGRVLAIQSPRIGGRMASSATARASVARAPWLESGAPIPRRPAEPAGGAQAGPTDLALFIETVRRAASR